MSFLDQISNPFLDEVKNPFDLQDPLKAGSMDQATDIMAANTRDFFQRNPLATSTLGVVGKVLQPFAAPQQVLFAGIRAGRDLFDGDDETDAWETMKRGGRSALAYATYQGGRDLPGFLKNTAAPDPTIKPITGYELFKETGAPNWVARWGGTAADFLLDVPLVGAVGKAAKVDKLTAGLKIGENMARSFDSPASLRAFVGGVMAAPFTTQPIKRIAEAIPQGLRQQAGQALIDPIMNLRVTPRSESAPVAPTLGQTLFARNQNVPEEVVTALANKNAVASQFAVLHNEALSAFDTATRGLDFKSGKELGVLVGRLADESDPGLRLGLEGQIKALETRTGRVGLFDDAIKATNKGVQFDVFAAEKLTTSGLMSPAQLAKYQAGDLRHLRRVYAMYGEKAEDQLRRLMDRANPASLSVDLPNLEQLYTRSMAQGIPMTTAAPTPTAFAQAVQAAYTNPTRHPADFLRNFFAANSMTTPHIEAILTDIGHDWAKKAGLDWRPADEEIVRHFTRERAANAGGEGAGVRSTTAVTAQRQEISDLYADVLGEVEDFTQRLNKQAGTVAKAATVNGVIKEIRGYLGTNGLIERIETADMGAIHKTAGLRVINSEQARQLGNGFAEGEVIPAEIHRILLEQVSAHKDAPMGLAWQWYSSRWQGVKLANPASILTNLKSTFVMADQAGHSSIELLRGMGDYLRLHKAAQRGDGAMDVGTAVNGVTMRELFNNGAFTHNTLMNTEVIQQSSRLMDELANPAGSPLQQKIAALQTWLTDTEQGAKVADGYATAVTPMRWLGDMYGRVDSLAKGGLYMTLRRKGMTPEKAAKIADETFFNYQNVPYVVDGLRRFGLLGMPFASFKFLAAGRFMRSMYQNPYGVEKYYRLGNSSKAALNDEQEQDGTNSLTGYEEGSPDYVRRGLYVPMGRDSEGRQRAVRFDDILPESAVFDAFNADGVAGTIPPAVAMAAQIVTGKGYQGRDTYRTGEGWAETSRMDPQEAARGVIASLWQFGAYPWAPGQPMTERIVKAIAAKSVPVETIADPKAQAVLKLLSEGPAAPFDRQVWSAEKKGTQPVPDVADALARLLGVKSYPITTTTAQPGSMRSNKQGLEADLQTLDTMMNSEMRQAATEAQRQEIRERYRQKREPILLKLRGR